MIERVLEAAARRAEAADAWLRDGSTSALRFEAGRLKEGTLAQEAGLNLRVIARGRVGVAGTTDLGAPDELVERALASASLGEELTLSLPPLRPPSAVPTFDDTAAGLDTAALAALGRRVLEQLARPLWHVSASVDRTVETVRFANSTGQAYTYRSTGVSVAAEVTRVGGDDVLMVYDHVAGAGPPTEAELDAVAQSIIRRMALAERVVTSPEGRLPVLFTPTGSAAVLLPLLQALSGKSVLQGISPLGGRLGETVFDPGLSLTDEPLLPGRLGSRPADDEGVPSARTALIERGVVRGFVYDLETAARAGATSTGHGRRSIFGRPAIGFTNLVVGAGELDETELLGETGAGLVVDELIGVGQGNVISGAFSHPVALAYRVEGGEIVGRVKDAAVAGNSYELLKRIRAIGRVQKWIGGRKAVPAMVVEGVNVAAR